MDLLPPAVTAYLPPHDGYLPKWLFLVAIISTANSVQSYRSLDYARQLYASSSPSSPSPANPLSARTFGTWTFLSAVVRAYAAYHITQPVAYDLALWTYGIALAHFVSEWLVFGSARLQGRFVAPLVVASSTLAWMVTQRGCSRNDCHGNGMLCSAGYCFSVISTVMSSTLFQPTQQE
ncbi:hypothetical protein VTN00DRAFT_17 [Thermoascus crustaceus]|uniref:uncharacterized protein n=1 Tax=Thermoascus crustaceus TaxID=5088 RepID=UPI003743F434